MVVHGIDEQGETQGDGHDNPMGSGQIKGPSKEQLAEISKSERRVQKRIKDSVSPGAGLFTPTGSTSVSRIQQIEQLREENAQVRKKISEYEDDMR